MRSKQGDDQTSLECCMCGDHGLSYELFRCRICLVRSQHRYCSNVYPRAESNRVCNWCLNKEGTNNLSLSCTTSKKHNNTNTNNHSRTDQCEKEENKKKKLKINRNGYSNLSVKIERRSCEFYVNSPIKKERPLPTPDLHHRQSSARKKISLSSERTKQESLLLRRTKSEEVVKSGMGRQVFRSRVPRYKLLEDVST